MKGAWISINQTEVFPVAILPYPASASLALGNMAVFGAEFALDLSLSKGSEERGELCFNESFLRQLRMRAFWKAKEMNSRQSSKTCCTKTQEVPLGTGGRREDALLSQDP